MLSKIKNRINRELSSFIQDTDRTFSLSKKSALLFKNIKDFILRKGKRARPVLFIIGYLGFSKKVAPGLYRSALSLELLHDFFLIHDDIIDKSDKRRGKPTLHKVLNNYLKKNKGVKFSGEDLTIVLADVMYAMAIHAFLSVKENSQRKEKALRRLIEAAIYTTSGEFIELLSGIKGIENITKPDIYQIYDLKTAYYTFACPLAAGATLAGANRKQIRNLFNYGIYLGRAFQIKDDILGMFGEEDKIGKSLLTDLQEAKKTLIIWYAYNNSPKKNQQIIKNIFSKKNINISDLLKMRKIITTSGALDCAKKEISHFIERAQSLNKYSKMQAKYKNLLNIYTKQLLDL